MATPAGIFKVSRPGTQYIDHDEFDSFVVACRDVFVARRTHPRGEDYQWSASAEGWMSYGERAMYHSWTSFIDDLIVERIGDASPGQLGVICSSFNAG